jgi:DNA-binding NarL/FixJ family response regulator
MISSESTGLISMPRPLRKPDDYERDQLIRVSEINTRIAANIQQNKDLASERREVVTMLLERGWSMYGIALQTGVTPNTIKRIMESR